MYIRIVYFMSIYSRIKYKLNYCEVTLSLNISILISNYILKIIAKNPRNFFFASVYLHNTRGQKGTPNF